ncbi:cupin domain-containing protein [Thaumasiovibrio sp. DFM-14]|uniref:cupin domain-containing protein n=1 Tax=Thaumasiovibrio sp. DFM-14 TaxID=3384792 RepID=UPI0039A29F8D
MLNMDFTCPCFIDLATQAWQQSPKPGVTRQLLERENAESGHTTSIVRYQAGAHFAPHSHPLGEEIFVLEGTFSDEHGHYPAGSYLRNPPGSQHAPYSENGCLLFVKLNQFHEYDTQASCSFVHPLSNLRLHHFANQNTDYHYYPCSTLIQLNQHATRSELLLIEGSLQLNGVNYNAPYWVRIPVAVTINIVANQQTRLLIIQR